MGIWNIIRDMDKRILWGAIGVSVGTILLGVVTNAITTLVMSGGDTVIAAKLLFYSFVFAAVISLAGLIINIFWWKSIVKKIVVSYYDGTFPNATIHIYNGNRDEVFDLSVYPIYIETVSEQVNMSSSHF